MADEKSGAPKKTLPVSTSEMNKPMSVETTPWVDWLTASYQEQPRLMPQVVR